MYYQRASPMLVWFMIRYKMMLLWMAYHTFSRYFSPSPCEISYSIKKSARNGVISWKQKRDWPSVVLPLNTPLPLTASLWELFKISSYEILEVKFRFSTKTLVYLWVFMLLAVFVLISWRCKVLKSIRALTVKNDSGCKVSPRTIFTVKSFINLATLHCHRINIIIATSLKMSS